MRYPVRGERMQPERAESDPHLLTPLLIMAAAIRIAVNNVATYSRADETVYLLYAKALASGAGYPQIVRMYVDDPGMALFPHPLRWSWLVATSLFCSATGECSHRTLATLSTLAGILVVALTYWIGRELFGPAVAAIAAALAATSPLQLALGRRALADEFFCASVLASVVALLYFARATERRSRVAWLVAWIVTTTIAMAAKEQFFLVYPLVLLFWWLRTRRLGWREVMIWMLPPFLYAAMFCLLARDVTSFFRIARITTSTIGASYAEQFQSGPPHRLIIDSLAIAPLVTLLAMAAVVSIALRRSAFPAEHRHLAVLAAGIIAVHAAFPSQNIRYIVSADSLLRVLVAAFLFVELREKKWMPALIVSGLLINTVVELWLFYDVFITGQVYDPVTDSLLRALRMLPH